MLPEAVTPAGSKPHDGLGKHRFTAAGFADDAHGLALREVKVHTRHDRAKAPFRRPPDTDVACDEKSVAAHLRTEACV